MLIRHLKLPCLVDFGNATHIKHLLIDDLSRKIQAKYSRNHRHSPHEFRKNNSNSNAMKQVDIFFGIKDKTDRLLQKSPISA